MKKIFLSALFLLPFIVFSQHQNNTLKSIDGIVSELLEQITIEKGEKMDTAAVRNLFYPTAQLTMLSAGDSALAESVSLNDFLDMLMDPYYQEGYLEKEIHKVVDEYNGIAQVFQSFYGKDSEGSEELGINSYQLVFYNDRWWIVSLLWTLDFDGSGLPAKYTAG